MRVQQYVDAINASKRQLDEQRTGTWRKPRVHREMSSHPREETRLRQFGPHTFTPWRWVLVADADGAMRALVQDDAPPTNIYVIGAVLSS